MHDQALKHIVEQRDLFVRKLNRAVDEKIGHAAQVFDRPCAGSVFERGLQLVEQVFGGGSRFRTHDSNLERSGTWTGGGFFASGNESDVDSGAGDAVASLCLGCVKRAVGAREK